MRISRLLRVAKFQSKLFGRIALGFTLSLMCAALIRFAGFSEHFVLSAGASLARLSQDASVRAAGRGNPSINLSDGRDLVTEYSGPAELIQVLQSNQAQPLTLASADFDEDGVPDLISGYANAGSGIITLTRGNVDAIYPNSPEAQQRRAQGAFTDAPFLSPARVFESPQPPDFIGAGDFDGDDHWDVVTARRGGDRLYLLAGDGKGGLRLSKEIALPGGVTALAVGEINRRDGLDDVVVGIVGMDGAKALVFEGPEGALRGTPETFIFEAEATSLATGQLGGGYEMDWSATSGQELTTILGRDRRLSYSPATTDVVPSAQIDRTSLGFAVKAIALGDFSGSRSTELAFLSTDGSVYVRRYVGQTLDKLNVGPWPQATGLMKAHVSGQRNDDLVVLDKAGQKLQIIGFTGGGAPLSVTPFDTQGEPIAVLPMRLNSDGLSDLVILSGRQSAPIVRMTQPGRTFVVTNTNDSGAGSLRQALLDADSNPGADAVRFNIPGQGLQVITLKSTLQIEDTVTIDGTTQNAGSSSPSVKLNGSMRLTGFFERTIANNSVVRGLDVSSRIGLDIVSECVIEGNVVNSIDIDSATPRTRIGGTALAARNIFGEVSVGDLGGSYNETLIQGNFGRFIKIFDSNNNTIGGRTPGAGNLISEGSRTGVVISEYADGNLVQGNIITLNAGVGVQMDQSFTTTIGGTTRAARNIISGNSRGISASNGGKNNIIQGNYIGVGQDGETAIPNKDGGVVISDPFETIIGGTVGGAGNVISANDGDGISLVGAPDSVVQGNFIGTDANGTQPRGNNGNGVVVTSSNVRVENNVIGANKGHGVAIGIARGSFSGTILKGGKGTTVRNNHIGTDITASKDLGNVLDGIFVDNNSQVHLVQNNVIAFNKRDGVFIPNKTEGDFAGFEITIISNSIFSNTGIGIALGVTEGARNDVRLEDDKANRGQNFPILTSVVSDGQLAAISGILRSPPPEGFRVEFFSNSKANTFGRCKPEGKVLLHSEVITPGKIQPDGSFTVTFPKSSVGDYVNCTATSGAGGIGDTSEFSDCVQTRGYPIRRPTGPIIQEVSVTPDRILARGFGFGDPVQVFVNGIGFKNPSTLNAAGRELIQTGQLNNGESITKALLEIGAVKIRFRNNNGGQTEITYKY